MKRISPKTWCWLAATLAVVAVMLLAPEWLWARAGGGGGYSGGGGGFSGGGGGFIVDPGEQNQQAVINLWNTQAGAGTTPPAGSGAKARPAVMRRARFNRGRALSAPRSAP